MREMQGVVVMPLRFISRSDVEHGDHVSTGVCQVAREDSRLPTRHGVV
jgi:hypothetical protein